MPHCLRPWLLQATIVSQKIHTYGESRAVDCLYIACATVVTVVAARAGSVDIAHNWYLSELETSYCARWVLADGRPSVRDGSGAAVCNRLRRPL